MRDFRDFAEISKLSKSILLSRFLRTPNIARMFFCRMKIRALNLVLTNRPKNMPENSIRGMTFFKRIHRKSSIKPSHFSINNPLGMLDPLLSLFIPFSSPEAALLLVSTKNRDLWPGPTPEVRDSWTSRHSAHAQSLSMTNLIGSALNPLCLQSHLKPECR